MPFVKDEHETILWQGTASIPDRMRNVAVVALALMIVGGYFFAQGSGSGLALVLVSFWFLLPSLLYFVAKGSRYYVTSRRVVREKFPFLQQLELAEIRRVRSSIVGRLLGLWTVYFYPEHPLTTYYIVFSYLNKDDPARIKKLVEEAKQGFIAP